MSKDQSSGGSSGIGFCGLLTILFIGLKLGGVIDWSWGLVLGPLWIPLAAGVTGFMMFLLALGIVSSIASLIDKYR